LKPLKLIFLDIDGVMNSWFSVVSDKHESLAFDPKAVENLKYILDKTAAKIVVSSTWRIGETVETLKDRIFSHYGLESYIIGVTPAYTETPRGLEIADYLAGFYNVKIDSFVILDDDSDMVSLKKHHVRMNEKYGLTKKDAERVIEILMAGVIK
jgi:hypothetical protein